MINIYLGLLMIILNMNRMFEVSPMPLFYDFLGYSMITIGVIELAKESTHFKKFMPFVLVLAVCKSILCFMEPINASSPVGNGFPIALNLSSIVLSIYIIYLAIMGVKDIEQSSGNYLNSRALYSTWKWFIFILIISNMLLFTSPALPFISLLLGIIPQILFMVSFYSSQRMYYSQRTEIQ